MHAAPPRLRATGSKAVAASDKNALIVGGAGLLRFSCFTPATTGTLSHVMAAKELLTETTHRLELGRLISGPSTDTETLGVVHDGYLLGDQGTQSQIPRRIARIGFLPDTPWTIPLTLVMTIQCIAAISLGASLY